MKTTTIFGHRGASAYRAENTLDAFSLALEMGADGIELDVHLTKDGHAVVAHDERLERVSDGKGLIVQHTLAELRELNFNTLFPELPGCVIPTLSEVYELVSGGASKVNVELKTTEQMYPELPSKLIALEKEHGMKGRIIYSSFNHYSLMELRKLDTDAEIGLLYAMGLVDPWVYANHLSANAIHPHFGIVALLPETVAKCHQNGVAVNVWTVDDENAIALMLKSGVDAVITNKPDVAVRVRDSLIGG